MLWQDEKMQMDKWTTHFNSIRGTIPEQRFPGLCWKQFHQPSPSFGLSQQVSTLRTKWYHWWMLASLLEPRWSAKGGDSSLQHLSYNSCSYLSFLHSTTLDLNHQGLWLQRSHLTCPLSMAITWNRWVSLTGLFHPVTPPHLDLRHVRQETPYCQTPF